jgi:hypothetical protein
VRIVGVEDEAGQAGREIQLEREALEEPGAPFCAVEVQIGGELFRLLVEDVEPSVEVVDEEAASAGFVSEVIHTRELCARVGVRVVGGDRQGGVVLQFQGEPRRGCCAAKGRATNRASTNAPVAVMAFFTWPLAC